MAMKVISATSASDIKKRLKTLIRTCERFHLVTAWVTVSDIFEEAVDSGKMASMVIGTHRYFTDPEVLVRCIDQPKVKVMHPTGPLFHPKLYIFEFGNELEIFLGSANFTNAGLSKNIECGAFIRSSKEEGSIKSLATHARDLWKSAEKLDEDFVDSYKANHQRARDAKKDLELFVPVRKPNRTKHSANDISPHEMSWNEFVKRVKADKIHSLEDRLDVLSEARQIFACSISFFAMEESDRKCIAGLQKPAIRDGVDWAFFGHMAAFGSYVPTLRDYAKEFSGALDHIPLQGPVKRRHYDNYLTSFKKIPGSSKNWLGMGTRLLAMKRPDYFVCIDSANRTGLCNYFSTAPSTTNLDNYWDRIIAPMMLTPWWQQEATTNSVQREIWLGRAAMLDAIYYDPKPKR